MSRKLAKITTSLVVLLLLIGTFSGLVWQISSVQATTFFSDGFETNLTPWSGTSLSGSGNQINIVNSPVHHGAKSAEFLLNTSGDAWLYQYFTNSVNASIRFYWYFNSFPASESELMEADTAAPGIDVTMVNLYPNSTGTYLRLYYHNGSSGPHLDYGPPLITKTWYSIEVYTHINNGTGISQLYINGAIALNITGLDNTANGNTLGAMILGFPYFPSGTSITAYLDCVEVSDQYIGPEGLIAQGDDVYETSANSAHMMVRTSTGLLYAVYFEYYSHIGIYVASSADNGTTWVNATLLSTLSGMLNGWQPAIAVDSNNVLYVVWRGTRTAYYAQSQIWFVSSSNGITWSSPIVLSIGLGMNVTAQSCPVIAVDALDNVHVSWFGYGTGYTFRQIWATDYNGSWSVPVRVSTYPGMNNSDQFYPSITVTSGIVVDLDWRGSANGYVNSTMWFSQQINGSWLTPVIIDPYPTYPVLSPVIGSDGSDIIYASWQAAEIGYPNSPNYTANQMWVAAYINSTWGIPVRISTYSGMENYPQSEGSIAVDTLNRVYVFWWGEAFGFNDSAKVWFASYNVTWSTPVCLQSIGLNQEPLVRWSSYPLFNIPSSQLDYMWTAPTNLVRFDSIPLTANGVYHYTFNFTDLNNASISTVNWQLYNGSSLLNYTQGSNTLTPGTYNLKTFYHGQMVNSTSLTTPSYGNTTIQLKLNALLEPYGLLVFDKPLTNLTIISQTSTDLGFIANGTSGPYSITVGVLARPLSVTKDNVSLVYGTDWTYDASQHVVLITTATLSVWHLLFITGPPPPETYILTVVVKNQTIFVPGVTVSLNGTTPIITDLNGAVIFTLNSGTYIVTINYQGITRNQTVLLTSNQQLLFDVFIASPSGPNAYTSAIAITVILIAVAIAIFLLRRRK